MDIKKEEHDNTIVPVATLQEGAVNDLEKQTLHDAVFVGWLGTVALMMKTQIGLGVLSIPLVFDALGLVPGVICLLAIGGITTWSDYIVGVFKINHPDVYGIDDVGQKLFGRFGRIVFGTAFVLFYIFVAGSAMLSVSIGLNTLSSHGACTAVFVAVAAIVGFLMASIPTLGTISWLAWGGVTCIIVSIFTLMVSVGIENRPSDAPQSGVWKSDYKITSDSSFTTAISACSSLVFAYAGTPAFFSIASEMRDPRHYTRSLIICQSGITVIYLVIGIVVYYFCGSYVASPALGSAGVTMKKVCYGIALPGLLVTTMLVTHLPAKFVFVRILKGSKHLVSNSTIHWITWLGCTGGVSLVAYIIASGIPQFGPLVSLIGALLGTLMSFQPMGCMWLYDNWKNGKEERSLHWKMGVCWSVFVIVSGMFLTIAGTYGSVVDIIDASRQSSGSGVWTCADNS